MSKRTPKNSKIKHNTPVVLCWHEKKFGSKKRQQISFRPQGGTFPTETIMLVVREALVCEKLIPKPAPNGTIFLPRHVDAIPWYLVKFHELQTSFRFTRILKPCISMLAAEQQCQGVWHSFSFLACDLSLQPGTHIWFCNPFRWTGACACSSIFNYAHKCLENPVNV